MSCQETNGYASAWGSSPKLPSVDMSYDAPRSVLIEMRAVHADSSVLIGQSHAAVSWRSVGSKLEPFAHVDVGRRGTRMVLPAASRVVVQPLDGDVVAAGAELIAVAVALPFGEAHPSTCPQTFTQTYYRDTGVQALDMPMFADGIQVLAPSTGSASLTLLDSSGNDLTPVQHKTSGSLWPGFYIPIGPEVASATLELTGGAGSDRNVVVKYRLSV